MEQIIITDKVIQSDGKNITLLENHASLTQAKCTGNACDDIDYEYDSDIRSFIFYNDGDRKVEVNIHLANIGGCVAAWKTKKMRPGSEWIPKVFMMCGYTAKYADK